MTGFASAVVEAATHSDTDRKKLRGQSYMRPLKQQSHHQIAFTYLLPKHKIYLLSVDLVRHTT
jgi:hypothetical protein